MLDFYQKANPSQLQERANQLQEDVIQSFGSLDPVILSTKPDPKEWSAGECFEHLSLTMQLYFPTLQAVQNGSYKAGVLDRFPSLASFFANFIMQSFEPSYQGMTVNAPASLRPSQSQQGSENIELFLQTQRDYLALMQQFSSPAQLNTIIKSPLVAIARYSLIDSFRMTIMHNEHHINQAKRAVAQAQQALSQA